MEEISNAKVFKDSHTTFRRAGSTQSEGVFICVKNYIASLKLWTNEDFQMVAIRVKGGNTKVTWKRTCE
jgi:hypothetical protein